MSHQEYIAACSEDQLTRLIELAQQRLDTLKKAGWVSLWIVTDGFQVFARSDKRETAAKIFVEQASKLATTRGDIELQLTTER